MIVFIETIVILLRVKMNSGCLKLFIFGHRMQCKTFKNEKLLKYLLKIFLCCFKINVAQQAFVDVLVSDDILDLTSSLHGNACLSEIMNQFLLIADSFLDLIK
jgi:hypothetical protein